MEEIMDVQNIQPQAVEGATAETGETPEVKPAESKSLSSEDVQKMINEAVEAKGRHFQSIADRDIKKANESAREAARRAEAAEIQLREILAATNTNPAASRLVNTASMKAQSRINQTEAERSKLEQMRKDYENDMRNAIKEAGVDPESSEIDWAEDAPSLSKRTSRIMASVAKVKDSSFSKEKEKLEQMVKETEARIRKELGLDKVDNTTGAGVTTSDSEFLRKFANYEIPMNEANMKRYNQITQNRY